MPSLWPAGQRHGCDFVSVIPTNLYGPTTIATYVPPTSSRPLLAKIDAAVRERGIRLRFGAAGRPRRKFLHVNDLADAVVLIFFNENLVRRGTDQHRDWRRDDHRTRPAHRACRRIWGAFHFRSVETGRNLVQASLCLDPGRDSVDVRTSTLKRESAKPSSGPGAPADRHTYAGGHTGSRITSTRSGHIFAGIGPSPDDSDSGRAATAAPNSGSSIFCCRSSTTLPVRAGAVSAP